MAQKKVLYEALSLGSSFGREEIYQEGNKVVFDHTEHTDETGHNDSFSITVDIDVYKKAVNELLATGRGVFPCVTLPSGVVQLETTLERDGRDLILKRALGGEFAFANVDFSKLVI